MNDRIIYFILGGFILLGVLGIFALPAISDIPPTAAFFGINGTDGSINATTYRQILQLIEGSNIDFDFNNTLKQLTVSSSGGSSPNELYCTVGQWFNAFNATTNNFNCQTVPAGSVYENNTASNLSPGTGLFTTKSGVDLPFKSLAGGTGITLSNNATTVLITATGGTGDNLGNHTATQTLNMKNNILDNVNYISSNAANPATIGTMRMGVGEAQAWRNNANTDNNYFYFSAADALTVTINSVGEYQLTSTGINFAGNNATSVSGIEQNGDISETGFMQLQNGAIIGWEASPASTDLTLTSDASENLVLNSAWNVFDVGLNPFNNAVFDVAGTGNRLTSAAIALGDLLKSDGTDFKRFAKGTGGQFLKTNAGGTDLEWGSGDGAGAVTLGSDVTCTATATYCTVFTIPLTISSGNAIHVQLVADSNTAGAAIQTRARGDDAQASGFCVHRVYTSTTAETLDVLTVTGTPADTGETIWTPQGANVPTVLTIDCSVEADASSPQNLIVDIQMETASTGTIQKGSHYIKTP